MENKGLNPFFQMQYIAYCRAVFQDGSSLDDYATYCQFMLSKKYNIPFKSKIFESYTREELIVEYFSHMYDSNEELRNRFEETLIKLGLIERKKDIIDWLDEMVEKENKTIEQEFKNNPSKIEYTPGDNT